MGGPTPSSGHPPVGLELLAVVEHHGYGLDHRVLGTTRRREGGSQSRDGHEAPAVDAIETAMGSGRRTE